MSHPAPVSYRPYIDGLRAIAILAVVIYHLEESWLPGGFLGVDLFFLISGFVVSLSLSEYRPKSFTGFLSFFYSRRFLRIVPALIVCLLLTSFFATLFIPDAWLSNSNQVTAKYAFFGLSNFFLISSNGDYFSPQSEFNPFTHTWSLGVEEQFYFTFPLMFYFWLKARALSPRRRRLPVLLLVLLTFSSFLIADRHSSERDFSFYALQTRFWELGAGILLFFISNAGGFQRVSRLLRILAWVGAGAVLYRFFVMHSSRFPVPGAVPTVGGAFLLLGFLEAHREKPSFLRNVFEHPSLLYLGKISYSLYLWHWPVIVLFRWTWGLSGFWNYLAAITLMIVLSLASFYWIENPFRKSAALKRMPRSGIVLTGLGLVVLFQQAANTVFEQRGRLSLSVVTRSPGDWYPHPQASPKDRFQCEIEQKQIPFHSGTEFRLEKKACSVGGRIFMIGDSHAAAEMPMVQKFIAETSWEGSIYTGAGCSVLSLHIPMSRRSERCREFTLQGFSEILKRARAGDVVFLSTLRVRRFEDQWSLSRLRSPPVGQMALSEEDRLESKQDARRMIAPLLAKKVRVILEAPKPIFFAPAFRCSDWFNRMNPDCALGLSVEKAYFENYRQPVMLTISELKAEFPSLEILDFVPFMCPGQVCDAFHDQRPLFVDGDHLSQYGNEFLYPSFEKAVLNDRAVPAEERSSRR